MLGWNWSRANAFLSVLCWRTVPWPVSIVPVAIHFCYELAAADFNALLGMSAPFRDFCTRRIANLLEHSKQLIQAQYTQSSAEQQSLTSPLSAIIRREPVTCSPDTSVRKALELMHETKVGSMIAVDGQQHPLGILTLLDVLERIVLPQIDLDQPVIGIMTTQLTSLAPQALAHDAALVMAKHGFRHVLVVENERLVGMVSEKDLFALQRVGLRQIGLTIRHADSIDGAAASGCRYPPHGAQHDGAGCSAGAADAIHFHLQRSAHRTRDRAWSVPQAVCNAVPRRKDFAGWLWVRKAVSNRR